MTAGPPDLTSASTASFAFSAWSMWQIDWVLAFGPEPGNLVEGEIGAGSDDQKVVADRFAIVELDPVLRRIEALGAFRPQLDAALGEDGRELDGDFIALPPADRDPRI